MRKIAGWITIAAVFMVMMTWAFAPHAAADKNSDEPVRAGSDLEAQAARKKELSERFKNHVFSASRDKGISFWPDGLFQLQAGKSSARRLSAEAQEEAARGLANDPDLSPDMGGVIDKEAYLKARGDQIAMQRGVDPDQPFDLTKRIQAIRQMETQEAQAAKATRTGIKPEAVGVWTPIGPNFLPNGQTEDYPVTMSPVSGRLTAIDIHPTNANIAYVGTAQGGLWRTTDGGLTWTPLLDTALSLAIGAVTIDPVTPSTVFVGTGEGNNNSDGYPGVGIYIIKTADTAPVVTGPFSTRVDGSGTTAGTATDAFLNSSITRIAVDPNNDNRIFVGNNISFSGNPGVQVPNITTTGLYFSDNAQSATPTFSKVGPVAAGSYLTASNQAPVTDVVFEPGSSNNLLIFVDDRFGLANGGVWRTTNATAAPASAPTLTRTLTIGANINGRLAIQKTGAVVTAYVAAGDIANPTTPVVTCDQVAGTVRKSVDGGATWSVPLVQADGFCYQQCFYDIAIDVDPTNANNVHLGGWANASGCDHVYEHSTDGGTTFNATESGLHADTHAVRVAPSSPNTVWFGSDGGIFKSIDQGDNWVSQNPNGISALQFQSLAVHPTSRNYTIGGTQDNGSPRRDDLGNWTRADLGDGGYALIDQASTDTAANMRIYHTRFADTAHLTYQRATNGAQANDLLWNNIGCGYSSYVNNGFGTTPSVSGGACPTGAVGETGCTCKPTTSVLFYPPMALGPLTPNSVYYGSDRLWRSTDNGTTMVQVSQGPITSGIAITTIAVESTTGLIAPRNDNIRLVGLRNGTVFGTITGSTTLVTANFTPPTRTPASTTNRAVGRLAIDPINPNNAYLTLAYYQPSASFSGTTSPQVWKTTNLNLLGTGTVTWSPAGNGIPNIPVNAFAIDAGNPNNLFAGTDIGVYNSSDGGATWTPFGTGLPRVAVFDMAINRAQSTVLTPPVLRVATHGRGMYETAISAPTAAGTDLKGQVLNADGSPLAGVVMTTVGGSKVFRTLTDSQGRYAFDGLTPSEFYTVMPALTNYSFSPVTRSYSMNADVADATFTAAPDAVAMGNPLNTEMFFVRQQYIDFLGREPDNGGLAYWTTELERCGADAGCLNNRRVGVAAAFFIEQEYQQTGSFVYRLYKGALGRQLSYAEFSADRGLVQAGAGLEQSKANFAEQFVKRAEFTQKYDGQNNAASFVDALIANVRQGSDVNLAGQRDALIAKYNGGSDINQSRSLVLREVIENNLFREAEYNPSFVLMEYFGYLKRDPEADGFRFWLNVLNDKEPGNYRGMVCSFITSAEYQNRFSPVVTHSNSECGH